MLKELELTRNWQHEQCKLDQLTKAKIVKMEEHIKYVTKFKFEK